MSSLRFPNLMYRHQRELDYVLNDLTFSSSAENDVGGLDEALQKFAEQKSKAALKRRGPIQGIPDEDSDPVRFEVAEDIVASSENFLVDNDSPNTLSNSFPSYIDTKNSSVLSNCHQEGGHNIDPLNKSGFLNKWRRGHRRRSVSLTDSGTESHPQVPTYLSPAYILTNVPRPFRRSPRNISSATASTTLSLPDVRMEDGCLHFKCWAPPNLVSSPASKHIEFNRLSTVLEPQSRTSISAKLPLKGKEEVGERMAVAFEQDARPIGGKPVRRRKKERPKEDDGSAAVSCEAESVTVATVPAMSPDPLVANLPLIDAPASERKDLESQPKSTQSRAVSKSKRGKKSAYKFSMFRVYVFGGVLVALISICWMLSVSPFLWGMLVGGFSTYCALRLYHLVVDFFFRPSFDGACSCRTSFSMGATCCSLHNSPLSAWQPPYSGPLVLPQLRDLPAPPVPQLADEDPRSGPSSGPLGETLGCKLDKHNRPVYKAWMNEIVAYSPDTYHINNTHSVFVTLEGTHLRIQRPRKNVPRRAMFNVPVPSSCGVHFVHQRIYDMHKVTVSLLPKGLVEKRLWSKKYPICLTVKNEGNMPTVEDNLNTSIPVKGGAEPQAKNAPHSSTSPSAAVADSEDAVKGSDRSLLLDEDSAYAVSTSRYLRISTNAGVVGGGTSVEEAATHPQGPPDDFFLVRHSDLDEKIYLFARTCREKEAWFRRFRGASIGKPLLTTTQQAFKHLLTPNTPGMKAASSLPSMQTHPSSTDPCSSANSDEVVAEPLLSSPRSPSSASIYTSSSDADTELQMAYLRHMAKFMPASWLLRATQALQLNLNYVSCDSQIPWLNALIGRLFWDFLRHDYWLKRVQSKIQSKLKKIHLPYFVNELTVTSVEMGTELPVIRNAGKPFLDNQGLWIEAEIVYAGGFTVALETNINLMKIREKTLRPGGGFTSNAAPSTAELLNSNGAFSNSHGAAGTDFPTGNEHTGGAVRSLAAFLSDEEDSADSSTDSDRESTLTNAFASILPTAVTVPSPSTPSAFPTTGTPPSEIKAAETSHTAFSPEESSDLLKPKRRLYRIMDRITRSSYFQKAVDSKFVQRGMEYVSHKAINLQLEVSMLHGTLVLNLPPPPSDRLWYGFRGNPNLRFKLKPKFGETLVTIPRFLEILHKKITLEFQRVFVLPNMDDVVMPLLIPESVLRTPQENEVKANGALDDDASFVASLSSQQQQNE